MQEESPFDSGLRCLHATQTDETPHERNHKPPINAGTHASTVTGDSSAATPDSSSSLTMPFLVTV